MPDRPQDAREGFTKQGGSPEQPPLFVAFVWHMHQPFYQDTTSGDYSLPWVRLHALKDYMHMAEALAEHPAVHATFNLVPSLVQQLQDYADGRAVDRCLAVSLKESWTPEDREFMFSFFFNIHWDRFIRRYPRYAELLELRQRAAGRADLLSDGDYRDLAVWFNLAWTDPGLLQRDEALRALAAKGRGFSLADMRALAARQQALIGRILPLYRRLEEAGQVELSTSPYYHPILPLLVDAYAARESTPTARLPEAPYAHPEDAAEQLRRAMDAHERAFGRRPRGLWPSEGSVSQALVPLLEQVEGLRWLATDEGILAHSLQTPIQRDHEGHVLNPQVLYRPYRLQQRIGADTPSHLQIFFRDVLLSDRIGFVYKSLGSADAAGDLIWRLHRIRQNLPPGSPPALVSIILDGENCWEEYEDNGTPFLRELYRRLSSDPGLRPVTVSEYLDQHPAQQPIPRLFAGSWIHHNLRTWIGERAQNRAWDDLARARRWLVGWQRDNPSADPETLRHAWEELYITEGSDWFWWYYSCNSPQGENLFDRDFRQHLRNIYRLTGAASPAWLDAPILVDAVDECQRHVTAMISPALAATPAPSAAWRGAGLLELADSTGAMQRSQEGGMRRLYYGYDAANLYLRLESAAELARQQVAIYFTLPRAAQANHRPRLAGAGSPNLALHREIALQGSGSAVLNVAAGHETWQAQAALPAAVEGRVAEVRVPLAELGLRLGDTVQLLVVASRNGDGAQVLPAAGALELALKALA